MSASRTLGEIAALIDGEIRGDPAIQITGVAPLHAAGSTELTWVAHPRHRSQLQITRAAAVLVGREFGPAHLATVSCDQVEHGLALVLASFAPPLSQPAEGVHPTALVHPSAVLGSKVAVGPYVVVEAGARVGDNTVLHAGASVGMESAIGCDCRLWNNVVVRERCRIGDRVIIHPNAVIGGDGFGYYLREGRHCKIPHLGGVMIADDVEIGACACVDRSKTGNTVIGPGVKIDNLVQVAHNVEIGAHCMLCAQVGVAGSTRLGSFVVLGGQVGIRDNIVLNDGVMVAACSCVPQDVEAGAKVAGIPATEARQHLREITSLRKLPGLIDQLQKIAKRVESLEAAADHKPDG